MDHCCSAPKLPQGYKGSFGTMYYVRDMKRAIAFYRDAIGLQPQFESEGWTQFDIGGHALCLHAVDPQATKPNATSAVLGAPGLGELIITVEDIRKEVGRLKEKRVEFLKDIMDMGEHGMCVSFKDTEGNVLSLYQFPAQAGH